MQEPWIEIENKVRVGPPPWRLVWLWAFIALVALWLFFEGGSAAAERGRARSVSDGERAQADALGWNHTTCEAHDPRPHRGRGQRIESARDGGTSRAG